MANHKEIPTTDTAQIEQFIERLKQGKLKQQDTQLIETPFSREIRGMDCPNSGSA
jgi:hypothetical protein